MSCGIRDSKTVGAPLMSHDQEDVVVSRLKTNACPSGQELDEFSAMRLQAQEDSSLLHDMIAGLEARVHSLRALKQKSDGFVADLSVILHPIRRLPVEILCEIFKTAVATDREPSLDELQEHTFQDSLVRSQRVWALSEVCSSWREAAIGTPGLWTAFVVDIDSLSQRASSYHLLNTYLARSKDLSLSVHMYGNRKKFHWKDNVVVASLMASCSRWASLSVSGGPSLYGCLNNPPSPYAHLGSLSLDYPSRLRAGEMILDIGPHLTRGSMLSLCGASYTHCYGVTLPSPMRHRCQRCPAITGHQLRSASFGQGMAVGKATGPCVLLSKSVTARSPEPGSELS